MEKCKRATLKSCLVDQSFHAFQRSFFSVILDSCRQIGEGHSALFNLQNTLVHREDRFFKGREGSIKGVFHFLPAVWEIGQVLMVLVQRRFFSSDEVS